MKCPVCTEENPDGNLFCGKCGAALDSSGVRLRQQIMGVIEREFKDQELVAVQVADKAEDRLWRWGRLLGLALGFFLAGLGFFGVTTYENAKSRIGDAAQAAVDGLNRVAKQNEQTITGRGTDAILQMQRAETTSVSQIQAQTRVAGGQVAAVVLRAKANNGQLQASEKLIAAMQAQVGPLQDRIAAFTSIRDSSPDTPIGDINRGLFTTVIPGVVGNASTSYGAASTSESVTQLITGLRQPGPPPPYKEGASGSGVTAIQNRLLSLGCYAGLTTGTFDPATAAAVIKFVENNGRPSPYSMAGLLDTSPDAPEVLHEDPTPGVVDYQIWGELFGSSAKRCDQ
jgi:hypothetical protein